MPTEAVECAQELVLAATDAVMPGPRGRGRTRSGSGASGEIVPGELATVHGELLPLCLC